MHDCEHRSTGMHISSIKALENFLKNEWENFGVLIDETVTENIIFNFSVLNAAINYNSTQFVVLYGFPLQTSFRAFIFLGDDELISPFF